MLMLVPVPFWPTVSKNLALPSLCLPITLSQTAILAPLSPSFLMPNSACSVSLFYACAPAPSPAWWPPLESHQCITFLPCLGEPQTRHSTSNVVLQIENREKSPSAGYAVHNAAQDASK